MKKNLIKGICLFVAIVLIGNLIGPTFAGLSDFDVGSFMTKAEFDSAFSDIHSRFTTLEANVENKIDSQVVSSVEKCLDVKQSGYVGELLIGFTLRDNCLPLYDDTRDYKKTDYPELYAKMKNDVNLSKLLLAGSDADHFKLLNISDRYGKFGTTANAGELGNESLPNIKGDFSSSFVKYFTDEHKGAMSDVLQTYNQDLAAGGLGGDHWVRRFDASKGQTKADGISYVTEEDKKVYKDGAKVNPDHIVILPMIRYKLDKVQVDNKECPYAVGDIYQTISTTDPATRWAGTTWERIGTGNYLRFVGEGEVANQSLKAELPNAGGRLSESYYGGTAGVGGISSGTGAFKNLTEGVTIGPQPSVTSAFSSYRNSEFRLSNGQLNADGTTFVSEADTVYKNGGEVRPKSITAYGWIRTS